MDALPDFEENRAYRVDPYLHAAVLLQIVGEQVALETLTALAEDEDQGHKAGPPHYEPVTA